MYINICTFIVESIYECICLFVIKYGCVYVAPLVPMNLSPISYICTFMYLSIYLSICKYLYVCMCDTSCFDKQLTYFMYINMYKFVFFNL